MRSLLLMLPLAALLACGGSDSTSPAPVVPVVPGPGGVVPTVTTSVDMKSNQFTPAAIRVASGATVTWTNSDGFNHNVSFANTGVAATGNWTTGTKSLVMPAAAGVYPYTCTLHGGMNGSVQVQ